MGKRETNKPEKKNSKTEATGANCPGKNHPGREDGRAGKAGTQKGKTRGSKTRKRPIPESEAKETRKEKDPWEKPRYNMWQMSAYMIALAWREKEKKIVILGLLLTLLSVAGNLTNLFLSPTILGLVERRAELPVLLAAILGFLALSILFNAARAYTDANWRYGKITLRVCLVAMLNNKLATTSYPNLQDDTFQKRMTKTNDAINCNAAAGEAVWGTLSGLLENLLGFAVYLALLSAASPYLFAAITLITLIGYFINKPLNRYGYRHREELGRIEGKYWNLRGYAESPNLAKDIRLFGMRPWLQEIYAKTIDALRAFRRRESNVVIWGRIADLMLAFLRNGLVYAWLTLQVLEGDISVPSFLLYFSAAGGFSAWVTGILNNLLTLHSQSLELSNLRECVEYPEPFLFQEGRPLTPDPGRAYELRLEDVSFRYPGSEKDILSHINLTLHPGEKLAVVGLNGAGKTTLVKLLCGFYDPDEGRVLLDGQDIREYNRADYYRMFSAVFQDFTLLPATIAANVAQSEDVIDREKVTDCIAKAGLQEKTESLPQGYETLLNREVYEDAAMLSGGETQRLMLARALYKDAPFVILDEPTAALDPIAEADMYAKYHEMTAGRSSVYISHRLASTRFCDRILLIEDGRLAEDGTHESLLALGGRYAELFNVQSQYYREGDASHEG